MKSKLNETIRELIAEGDIEGALDLALARKSLFGEKKIRDIELLSGQYAQWKKNTYLGLTDDKSELNRITRALQDLVHENTTPSGFKNAAWGYLGFGLALTSVAVFLFFLYISKNTADTTPDSKPVRQDENPKTVESTQSKTEKPAPPPSSVPDRKADRGKNYFNTKFGGSIALVDVQKKNNLSLVLAELLKESGHNTSSSFFRSAFYTDYQQNLWNEGGEIMEELALPGSLKCVCLIREEVKYTDKEKYMVAKGQFDLKIIYLETGDIVTIPVAVGGAGADEGRAFKELAARFKDEFTLKQLNKFEPCRN